MRHLAEESAADHNGVQPSAPLRPTDVCVIAAAIGFCGNCSKHTALLAELQRIATTDAEVLLVGETGVGKELYAKFVHRCSLRRDGEFVAVNCASVPESLFENELFGHSEGAYTDARGRSIGLIAAAEKGSLFLDEIDHLSVSSQVKLLRLLQEKEYRRLGDPRLRRADVRLIAATNCVPEKAICEGRLRADLYYRINVVQKWIPPLRERAEDIEVLALEFLQRFCSRYGRELSFTEAALRTLRTYHWPGNIRQLENLVRSLVCEFRSPLIDPTHLPIAPPSSSAKEVISQRIPSFAALPFGDAKKVVVEEFETQYLREMLRLAKGNLCKAARMAGKPVRSFRRTMLERGIDPDEFRMP